MDIRWSQTALSDIDSIFAYIWQHNRKAASETVARIEALTQTLSQFPLLGHSTDEPDVFFPSCVIRF